MLSIWFQNSFVPYDEEIAAIYNNNKKSNKNNDNDDSNENEKNVNPMSNTMAASWLCKKTNVKELKYVLNIIISYFIIIYLHIISNI